MQQTVRPLHDIHLPTSTIYVTPSVAATTFQQRCKTQISDQHFILILKPDQLTQETIQQCNGKYNCYNCGRAIQGPMYFLPERYNPQTNEPTCAPIAHCRKECVYRTVQDRPNNGDLLTNLFLMYGHDIVCAPPRLLLFVPGGLTIEQYHESMDKKQVYEQLDPLIHAFIAPILISCTIQEDHQLLPNVVKYIDEIKASKSATIGPMRQDGSTHPHVKELEPKILSTTPLTSVFSPDPASFGRPGILGNPHMGVFPIPEEKEG